MNKVYTISDNNHLSLETPSTSISKSRAFQGESSDIEKEKSTKNMEIKYKKMYSNKPKKITPTTKISEESISVIRLKQNGRLVSIDESSKDKVSFPAENISNPSIVNQNATDNTLELERTRHALKSNLRTQEFEAIISDSPILISWTQFGFYIVGTVVLSFLSTIHLSLIPFPNLLLCPGYWYEILTRVLIEHFFNNLWFSSSMVITTGHCLNISCIQTSRNILIVFLIGYVESCSFYLIAYCIWTYILHYQYPVPFLGFIEYMFFRVPAGYIALWLQFPLNWRRDSVFTRRCINLSIAIASGLAVVIQYTIVAALLFHFKNEYQPFFALFLPAIKKMNALISSSLLRKVSDGDSLGTTIMSQFLVATQHALFLCIAMSSITTYATVWLIIAVRISLSIYICLRIAWLKRSNPLEVETQITLLQTLAICELIEFIAPLVFLFSLITAYYGPNSMLHGNIGGDFWHFSSIQDINEHVKKLLLYFSADVTSMVVSSILLWQACKINLYKAIVAVEKEFGMVFCLILGSIVTSVGNHLFILKY